MSDVGKVAACDRCGDPRAVYTLPAFCVCPKCDKSAPALPPEQDVKLWYKCVQCKAIGRFWKLQVANGKTCEYCQGMLLIDS